MINVPDKTFANKRKERESGTAISPTRFNGNQIGSHGGSGKTDGAVTESHARGGVIIALIVGLAAVAAVLWLLVRKRKKNTQGD